MEITGYFASILIGVFLGLIGSGGSILTVPVLVYLFQLNTMTATIYSLFVVGSTSIVGSASYFKKGHINLKTALVFGLPSIAAVFFARTYIVPSIPEEILSIGNYTITKNIVLLLLFALLMIFASYSMIKKGTVKISDKQQEQYINYPMILIQGIFIGTLTGLIGAGGGFLIIPVLVNLLKLPMKKAIGTSLVIISINSLTGFLFSISQTTIQWSFLLIITSIAMIGILIGSYISTKIDNKKLKPAFGWFVLIMGIYIIIKEVLFK